MGTFAGKVIADGQLPATQGVLYTVPTGTTVYIKSVVAHNRNAADQTVTLYLNPSGAARVFARAVLKQYETLRCDDAITLEAGDTIEAQASAGSAVDYLILGATEV